MSIYQQRSLYCLLRLTQGTPFFRYAAVSGATGTTAAAMTGDYSSASQEFILSPPDPQVWEVNRALVFIRGSGQLRADTYGDNSELANGIIVQKRLHTGELVQDICSDTPITSNASWASHSFDLETHVFGAGDNFVVCRWTFGRSGRQITLDGSLGEYLTFTMRDDLSGLVDHRIKLDGFRFS